MTSGALQWRRPRPWLGVALLLLLAFGGRWAWLSLLEQRWETERTVAQAAAENPLLAASRLLGMHGHPASLRVRLGQAELETLKDGTLLLAKREKPLNAAQAASLLAWVRRGNTLLMLPPLSLSDGDGDRDSNKNQAQAQADPIFARLGLAPAPNFGFRMSCGAGAPYEDNAAGLARRAAARKPEPEKPQLACATPPGQADALTLDAGPGMLKATAQAIAPLWSDDRDGMALRVYAEGGGHLVVLAHNFFDNRQLRRYDHAQLLLALAGLNRQERAVSIVLNLEQPTWQNELWQRASLLLCGLALLLALLGWRAARRFGPLLDEPAPQRRALLEHIDASGHWLWRAPGGPALLLAAARLATNTVLERRAPALQGLSNQERSAILARLLPYGVAELGAALHGPAPERAQSQAFTRQIQILQHVRQYHE